MSAITVMAMYTKDNRVLGDFLVMKVKILTAPHFNHYLQDYFGQQRECYEQFGEGNKAINYRLA